MDAGDDNKKTMLKNENLRFLKKIPNRWIKSFFIVLWTKRKTKFCGMMIMKKDDSNLKY